MDNATVQKLKEAIAKSANIGVVVGQDPTIDDMGAALSLYLSLGQAKKNVSIAAASEPIVEVSSLVGINRVQTSLGGESGDLVVSFPYEEGEIEKVSYTIENGFLNIIVKVDQQNGLSFEDKDVKYSRGSGAVDLLFVIGTPRLSDISGVVDSQKLGDIKVVNIDNKKENQGFGDIVLVSSQFSSVSEQIGDVILSLGLPVDQDVAQNLLSGISYSTQNFQDPRTSSLAFELAGILMKKGATRSRGERPERQERVQTQPQPRQENRQQPQDRDNGNGNRSQPRQHQQNQPRQNQSGQGQHQNRSQGQDEARQPRQHQSQPQTQHQQNQAQQDRHQAQAIQDQLKNEEEVRAPEDEAPVDWLSPKVYKGSSNF